MERRDFLFKFGVPALLSTVALVHQYASRKFFLSPWKGGGFGMFSTADSPAARFLRVYLVTSEGKVQVKLPKSLSKLATEVRTIPTKRRVLNLTRKLATSQWIAYSSNYSPQSAPKTSLENKSEYRQNIKELAQFSPPRVLKQGESLPSGTEIVSVQEVQLEVWQSVFDPKESQVNARKISSSVVKRVS